MKQVRSVLVLVALFVVVGVMILPQLTRTGETGTGVVIQAGQPQPTMEQLPTDEPIEPPPVVQQATAAPAGSQATAPPPNVSAREVDGTSPEGGVVDASAVEGWNPPALEVPLARHPNDHYFFIRPVGANFNNFALDSYPYGSDGPANDLRVHHGIDLSNEIGVEVYAAGGGRIIWADKGFSEELDVFTSYGNTVVIEHDFGYDGQSLYTLYAHMAIILVEEGQRVEVGDTIGLIGATGTVSGPHVHFEVRVGASDYSAVRNPSLWMAPYAGTGTVAGRIMLDDEQTLQDVEITLRDVTTGLIAYRTTSYAGVIPRDDNWQENFVFPDVRTGRYEVEASYGTIKWKAVINVQEGLTNWVELEIEEEGEPPTATP